LESFAIGFAAGLVGGKLGGKLTGNLTKAIGDRTLAAAVLSGAISGAVAGGISSTIMGGSFMQGFAAGALGGAIGGGLRWGASEIKQIHRERQLERQRREEAASESDVGQTNGGRMVQVGLSAEGVVKWWRGLFKTVDIWDKAECANFMKESADLSRDCGRTLDNAIRTDTDTALLGEYGADGYDDFMQLCVSRPLDLSVKEYQIKLLKCGFELAH
jgi:hypothetical protein